MFNEFTFLLEDIQENAQYEEYLTQHIGNVQKGYQWMKEYLPELLSEDNYIEETAYYGELDSIISQHDKSKYTRIPDVDNYYELRCEYDAYADYFYGDRNEDVEVAFDYAWLAHIHANPHHWQHWILHNDTEGTRALDMPYVFILEMLFDHWAFSWKANNLYEIFDWYQTHKDQMLLSDKTRTTYESLLSQLRSKLNEVNSDA